MKEIVITPYGGLANRMRTLNAAIEFAKAEGVRLQAVWFCNRELNAPYDALFIPPYCDENQIITIRKGGFFDRFVYRSPRRHTLWLPYIIAPRLFDTRIYSQEFKRLREQGELESVIKSGNRVLIESCYEFGDYYASLSKNFVPVPDILNAVNEYVAKNFTRNTVGIHIRRTDNWLSIQKSPLSLFIEAMQREIEACADTNFYVATDDVATKEELRRCFGNRILTLDTDCSRNSISGMKDAVKEMWILSRTTRIYGSFYSSYSVIASHLTNIPLQILQTDD